MEREFWWIRHGESEWNAEGRFQGHSDPSLSSRGESQARALAPRLANVHFDAIFCSDLKRAHQTAQLALPGGAHRVDQRLREIHFGDFEGYRFEDLNDDMKLQWRAWWRDPFGFRVPMGESMTDLAERVSAWSAELPEQGRFVSFTHGGLIRCVIWGITGAPPDGAWTLTFDNTSITRVRVSGARVVIDCLNDSGHLESLKC